MTEKRFTHKKWYDNRQLFDGDEAFAIVDVYNQAVTICNKLNELAEENQDNKAMIDFLDTENNQIMNELKTRTQIQHQLEEENEQLKQELDNIYLLIGRGDWSGLVDLIKGDVE